MSTDTDTILDGETLTRERFAEIMRAELARIEELARREAVLDAAQAIIEGIDAFHRAEARRERIRSGQHE